MRLQGGRALSWPKRGAENLAMLGLSGSAMLGGAPAQPFDEVVVEVPHQELSFPLHAINDSMPSALSPWTTSHMFIERITGPGRGLAAADS